MWTPVYSLTLILFMLYWFWISPQCWMHTVTFNRDYGWMEIQWNEFVSGLYTHRRRERNRVREKEDPSTSNKCIHIHLITIKIYVPPTHRPGKSYYHERTREENMEKKNREKFIAYWLLFVLNDAVGNSFDVSFFYSSPPNKYTLTFFFYQQYQIINF